MNKKLFSHVAIWQIISLTNIIDMYECAHSWYFLLEKYFFRRAYACQYLARGAAIQPRRRTLIFLANWYPASCTVDRHKVYREMRLGKYCVATCKVSASAGTWDSLRMHFICRTDSVYAWFASGRGLLRSRCHGNEVSPRYFRKNIYAPDAAYKFSH